jgi:hypothetical protein
MQKLVSRRQRTYPTYRMTLKLFMEFRTRSTRKQSESPIRSSFFIMCRPKGLSHGQYNQSREPHLPSSAVQVSPFSGRRRISRLRTGLLKVGVEDCSRFSNAHVIPWPPVHLRGGARNVVLYLQTTDLRSEVHILDASSYPVCYYFFSPPFMVFMPAMCDAFLVLNRNLSDQSLPHLCVSPLSFVRALFIETL